MFRFKQFTIQQNRTAMKVCTDACVLGAYADVAIAESTIVADPVDRPLRILDIGTGTGLLALMAAQRNPSALVDAIEVDNDAFEQAIENVAASPFANRVNVVHERIQDFQPTLRYDRILTNPPFYTNHLRSPDSMVNRALHADELPFSELVESVVKMMKSDGQWWVLLPPYESQKLTTLAAEKGLSPFRKLLVRHHAQKPVFRVVTGFSLGTTSVTEHILAIHELDGRTYTLEFSTLLHDFYLIF